MSKKISMTNEISITGYSEKHDIWFFRNCAFVNGKFYPYSPDENYVIIEGTRYDFSDSFIKSDRPCIDLLARGFDRDLREIHDIIDMMFLAFDFRPNETPSYNTVLILGYLYAVVSLQEISKNYHLFPFLYISGEPETGKTKCLQLIAKMFGLKGQFNSWDETTPANIKISMEQMSSLPFMIDNLPNNISDSFKNRKKIELLKNMYNRTSVVKGGIKKINIRQVNAALVLSGQFKPSDPALLSRCVVVRLRKYDDINVSPLQMLDNYHISLSILIQWLLNRKNLENESFMPELIEQYKNKLNCKAKELGVNVNERWLTNTSIILAYFDLYFYYFDSSNLYKWLLTPEA